MADVAKGLPPLCCKGYKTVLEVLSLRSAAVEPSGNHRRIVDVTLDGSAKLLRFLRPGAGQSSVHHVKVRAPGAHDGRQLDRSVGRHWPCHSRYEGHHGYRSSHA